MNALRCMTLPAILLAMALTGLMPSPARAAMDDASHFVEGIGNQALAIISEKDNDKVHKQAQLEKLFSDNVDFQWVGRFVMGRFWRQASDAQKARYLTEYQKFLILHYTSRFTDYSSGSFKITGAHQDADDEYTISMQIRSNDPGSEPVLVEYRVRGDDKNFKVFDVIVEGVSMITTQRSEFASVITNRGIDYLIDQLAAKNTSS